MSVLRRLEHPFAAITLATLLSFVAWMAAGDEPRARVPAFSALLWLLALAILLTEGLAGWRPVMPTPRTLYVVAGICLLAGFLRFVDLGRIPSVLSGNEAGVGLSARDYLTGGRTNLFDVGWWSFPSMHSWIQSSFLRVLGQTVIGLRFSSALIGTVTVAITYVYAARSFGRTVGLLSAAFLAASAFHIHFSRLGLNNIWESLFAVALAGGLSLAWATKDLRRFILVGVFLGLTQFFYVGGRMFVLLVPLWLMIARPNDDRPRATRLTWVGTTLWVAAVVVLPLAMFYARHPDQFLLPWRRVSLFWYWWDVQTVQYGDPGWWVVADQLIKAPLGFVLFGLTEFFSGPLLTPVAAALFLLGSTHVLRHLRNPDLLWLGLWLGGTIASVALSANPPAAQRYVGSAPAVAVLVAFGANRLVQWLGLNKTGKGHLRRLFLTGAMLMAVGWEIRHYFIKPAAAEAFGDFGAETAYRVAQDFETEAPFPRVFFFVGPGFSLARHESLAFLVSGLSATEVDDGPVWRIELDEPGEYSLIFLPDRADDLTVVRACLPEGTLRQVGGRSDRLLFSRYDIRIDHPAVCEKPSESEKASGYLGVVHGHG